MTTETAPIETRNEGRGFHGTALESARRAAHGVEGEPRNEAERRAIQIAAAAAFCRAAHRLVEAGHFASLEQARDFLDSRAGRHLGDEVGHEGDAAAPRWLKRTVSEFKATYRADDFNPNPF